MQTRGGGTVTGTLSSCLSASKHSAGTPFPSEKSVFALETSLSHSVHGWSIPCRQTCDLAAVMGEIVSPSRTHVPASWMEHSMETFFVCHSPTEQFPGAVDLSHFSCPYNAIVLSPLAPGGCGFWYIHTHTHTHTCMHTGI